MILLDTSAWVEYLRGTGSRVHLLTREMLRDDQPFAVCGAIRMEVLMGARSERHLRQLSALLARGTMLPTDPAQYDEAASLYRQARRQGVTVRKAMDCLIAAHTIAASLSVLHSDADFRGLARSSELQEHPDSLM